MTTTLLRDLERRAAEVAEAAGALVELLGRAGPRLLEAFSDDEADADLLQLGAILNDLREVAGRVGALLSDPAARADG
jgi:hypothetical protein